MNSRLILTISLMMFYTPSHSGFKMKDFGTTVRNAIMTVRLESMRNQCTKGLIRTITAGLLSGSVCLQTSPCIANDGLLNEVWGIVNENYVDSTFNGNDWSKIKEDYSSKVNDGADERKLTVKMLSKLGDKYSRLLDKSYFESLWKYDAIGIGLIFQNIIPGTPMVVSAPPLTGSSGEKAGIQKDDIIYTINGKSTSSMTAMDVLDMLSNDESDKVVIVYGKKDSNNNDDDKKSVILTRVKDTVTNPVTFFSQKVSNGQTIGYIKLKEFNSKAIFGLKEAITSLEASGVDEYVLDIRGNTGGGFQFALNAGGMFMSEKPMVIATGKLDDRTVYKSSYPNGPLTDKPLVLWVDGLSASASEVLAGGLHDNCRAVVVGSKTFGKGKIQAVFGLSDGEGLTLTVAQYLTPKGTVIQSKGLSPDLPIDSISPYIKLLTGPILDQPPDLNQIDYKKVADLATSCSVNNNQLYSKQ